MKTNSKTKAVSCTYNSCNSLNVIRFYKKMGQFDKNSGVISLFRSLINLNQGSFTFKNDEFQFYIHKNDEVYENAHFL